MAAPPVSTKASLQQQLSAHTRQRWPQLDGVDVRFRGAFAYDTRLRGGDEMSLMRLRYGGSATRWGFAIYLASKNGYQDSVLPSGQLARSPEDALDTACGLSGRPNRARSPAVWKRDTEGDWFSRDTYCMSGHVIGEPMGIRPDDLDHDDAQVVVYQDVLR